MILKTSDMIIEIVWSITKVNSAYVHKIISNFPLKRPSMVSLENHYEKKAKKSRKKHKRFPRERTAMRWKSAL